MCQTVLHHVEKDKVKLHKANISTHPKAIPARLLSAKMWLVFFRYNFTLEVFDHLPKKNTSVSQIEVRPVQKAILIHQSSHEIGCHESWAAMLPGRTTI